ncbi:hypothetical protein H0H93_011261 [Arthromyces matolae]|nr:hypothetical protein H0H93_011261 [Arthromyces matolae]
MQKSKTSISSRSAGTPLTGWMRLYTDACLLRSLVDLSPSTSYEAIERLDSVIIICGIASGRLDVILSTIKHIQQSYCSLGSYRPRPDDNHLSGFDIPHPQMHTYKSEVFISSDIPSLLSFQTKLSKFPFVIRGYARNWPALQEHPWRSAEYLRSISGPGRVVPVEIGADYRAKDWSQKLMKWDEFLSYLDLGEQPQQPSQNEVIYLAQHNLSLQFPQLLGDVIVPDYVYASLDAPEYSQYSPPGNDEQLVINMWLGPKGTLSPAHTVLQIVGQKTVWLAPPKISASMYAYATNEELHNPAANALEPAMSNTTSVDVFDANLDRFPAFWSDVVPEASAIVLASGDLLYIPPGWWHAMRSEETSFSVSMWF